MLLELGIIGLGTLVGGAIKSNELDQQAFEKRLKASNKLAQAQTLIKNKQKAADTALIKVANRKRAILSTSINDFIKLYERIAKINFVESDGIKELQTNMLTPQNMSRLQTQVNTSLKPMSDKELAGAFIFGYLFGGVAGGFVNSMVKESERNLSIAGSELKMARVAEEQAETIAVALSAIEERCNKLADILAKLNVLFVKSINHTNEIIDFKGYDRSIYSDSDIDAIMTCINLMKTIKQGIIDIPILDKNGAVTRASQDAIDVGNQYLKALRDI